VSDWHGWSISEDKAIHVGHLPGRKSVCLYTMEGSVLKVRAYFRSEQDAREFLEALDSLATT
jgi:hypothetical protein